MTLRHKYVWLALDEATFGEQSLASWSWDETGSRPSDAREAPYPRYRRPPSRNGFFDPAHDPSERDWRVIERAHFVYLANVAVRGRAKSYNVETDLALRSEVCSWADPEAERRTFDARVAASSASLDSARRARLALASRRPEKRSQVVEVFTRNPDVVAEVLHRARGRCEACGLPAPFVRAVDGSPYLEIHHRVRLADGGEDTVENALACCPNCHRAAHFG